MDYTQKHSIYEYKYNKYKKKYLLLKDSNLKGGRSRSRSRKKSRKRSRKRTRSRIHQNSDHVKNFNVIK